MTSLLNRSLNEVRRARGNGVDDKLPLKTRNNQSTDTWKHDLFQDDEGAKQQILKPSNKIASNDTRSNSLLITNLHYDVSEAELEALFSQIGKVDRGPFIKFDQSGRATEGLAFISFTSEDHAEAAIKAFNGASAKGQPINVQYEFGLPKWVRSALGLLRGPRNSFGTAPAASGLLGRIQHDRSTRRGQISPYDFSRPRGHRASFPPGNVSRGFPSRSPKDSSFPTGPRSRSGPGFRGSTRGRSAGDRRDSRAGVKSAKELDKELEAFMETTPRTNNAVGDVAIVPVTEETDVQMAE
ncbi:hypothetical protein O181_027058 [Austropuccinia psidii MF-1]|uniref:RRM domain-containing protein n=1 Tax=Austropuccinia psidii MF-1 TaxID=1389203 RepID=A0A9Q3H0K7_9BASI|nr:hypothetical protein [Austropuccinia psidii MF-1]